MTDIETENDYGLNPKDFAPGTMGFHEALHMASFLHRSVMEDLVGHLAVEQDPELLAEANKAGDALWALYQKMGAKHI